MIDFKGDHCNGGGGGYSYRSDCHMREGIYSSYEEGALVLIAVDGMFVLLVVTAVQLRRAAEVLLVNAFAKTFRCIFLGKAKSGRDGLA